jgi:hypothetical protein
MACQKKSLPIAEKLDRTSAQRTAINGRTLVLFRSSEIRGPMFLHQYRLFYRLGGVALLLALLLWYGSDLASQSTAQGYMVTSIISSASASEDLMRGSLQEASAATGIEGHILAAPNNGDGSYLLRVPASNGDLAVERTRVLFRAMAADFAHRSKPPLNLTPLGGPQPIRAAWSRPLMETAQTLAKGLFLCCPVLLILGYRHQSRTLPPALPQEKLKHVSESKFDY